MKSFPILPITEVKSSGALPPAAIIVAPATSSDMSSFSVITLILAYTNVPLGCPHERFLIKTSNF